jgi:Lon-like ATP-dependent protease
LYALLSALSGVPLRQGLAVTGSVNQRGEIQPIGGVNEKIEGFFRACRERGLTGSQGVLIPRANLDNLMLSKDVIDAVASSAFHIYPVSTIEEGIEILCGIAAGGVAAGGIAAGIAAGTPDEKGGAYPAESVFGRVAARLETMREAQEPKKDDEEDGRRPNDVTNDGHSTNGEPVEHTT